MARIRPSAGLSTTVASATYATGTALTAVASDLAIHEADRNNPHGTLLSQLPDTAEAMPVDHGGMVAWDYDPTDITTVVALPGSTLACAKMKLTKAGPVTSIVYEVAIAASGLTTALIGLYQVQGANMVRLGTSADLSTDWQTTAEKNTALTAPTVPLAAGSVLYAVFLAVGTTAPQLRSKASSFGNGMGLTAAGGWRFATVGSTTSLPASYALSSMTKWSGQPFVGAK